MRRNPDIKWRSAKKNLKKFSARQYRLLENLSPLVKPSGILVYAVCSPEPEENESVCQEFLNHRTDYTIDTDFGNLPDMIRSLVRSNGYLFTSPHTDRMDGFFMVRFKRKK